MKPISFSMKTSNRGRIVTIKLNNKARLGFGLHNVLVTQRKHNIGKCNHYGQGKNTDQKNKKINYFLNNYMTLYFAKELKKLHY